jgi:hypothetical protein
MCEWRVLFCDFENLSLSWASLSVTSGIMLVSWLYCFVAWGFLFVSGAFWFVFWGIVFVSWASEFVCLREFCLRVGLRCL